MFGGIKTESRKVNLRIRKFEQPEQLEGIWRVNFRNDFQGYKFRMEFTWIIAGRLKILKLETK